jgi:hypothetical protein
MGGSGGVGGEKGGSGGPGEGPMMSYDVKTEQFIVNNLYVVSSSPKYCFSIAAVVVHK